MKYSVYRTLDYIKTDEDLETYVQARIEYWQKDSAAAWDKCEEYRVALLDVLKLGPYQGEGPGNPDPSSSSAWVRGWAVIKGLPI